MNRILLSAAVFLVVAGLLASLNPRSAAAQSLIRDAETEDTIRAYSAPVFRAAGLNPDNVQIYLINDPSLNAFVAGGQRMFLHTGLLLAAEDAGEVIGVIAHETGHIAGGHLARIQEQLNNSTPAAIVALLAGIAAGVATGDAGTAAAVIAGGQGFAQSNLLAYSRTQEGSADQAGLSYLEATGMSAKGLLTFMDRLRGQELLISTRQDPYVRTHPLTTDRIDQIESHVARSAYSNRETPKELQDRHERMLGKLFGFLMPLGQTLRKYKRDNQSVEARYARAVGYFKTPRLERALGEIDSLIAEFPDDPYFHELRGWGLYRHGDANGALESYSRAVALKPDAPLIRKNLANVQIAVEDPALLKEAEAHLLAALEEEESVFAYEKLSIVYHRMGREEDFRIARAEAALLKGNGRQARFHAEKAARSYDHGSREWLKAQDIINAAQLLEDRKNRR